MVTYIILGATVLISVFCFCNMEWMYRLSLNPYSVFRKNEWFRIITHGFVHADYVHLFVNMFTFWSFGSYMESSFNQTGSGTAGYLGLYFGGMIFSSLYDLISKKNSLNYHSIGASGAVSAILFSYILFNPWGILLMFAIIPVPAIVFGVLYLVYCQYMSKRSKDNINHNAHFYGAIYGFVFPVILHPASMQIFIDKLMNFDLF